ncbi:MAG: hypothetical protein JNK85_30240 [Verrucomicrobiales bacterium]|nr:hypothetical protein [Verrucomicrobiales bacterium]
MSDPGARARPRHLPPRPWRAVASLILHLLPLLLCAPARAEVRFDVFVGIDDRIREGHWFPIAFEIENKGPSFVGTVVFGPDGRINSQQRSFTVELPSSTLKRIVLPAFSSEARYSRWEALLLDERGNEVAERNAIQPKDTAAQVPMLGALPRSFGGLPTLPEAKERSPEFQPAVARVQSDYFPSDPIALEALSAFYLNSEKATDLKPEQVDALLSWLHGGGHLIVAIEQPGDVTGLPWLAGLLPLTPATLTNRPSEGSFERWLVSGQPVLQVPSVMRQPVPSSRQRRSGRPNVTVQTPANSNPDDPFTRIEPQNDFNNADISFVSGRLREGTVVLSLGADPLILSAPRGLGTVTVLTFSPEREPFRGWKNRSWFWAKLLAVQPDLLVASQTLRWNFASIDGLLGAMLDSRQVRKLPVAALLLLLVVYLVVIGPFDQWILKRLGKQMWTWVTFPIYILLFSGLIYFIGYRLRAGDLELNELQIADQLPRGDGAAWRGRTWVSIYSPANARYRLASDQPFATLRSELQKGNTPGTESGRLELRHPGKGFDATAFVPVWVSQLFASDWVQAGPRLVAADLRIQGGSTNLIVTNLSGFKLDAFTVAYAGRLFEFGGLAAGQKLEKPLHSASSQSLEDFLLTTLPPAMASAQQRRFAFGGENSGRFDRSLNGAILASFAEHGANASDGSEDFSSPTGLDLNPVLQRGDGILFAWISGQGIAPPMHRFSPRRLQRDSVLRSAIPVSRQP